MKNHLSFSKKRFIFWLTLTLIILGSLFSYWIYRERHPSTDDAYVQAHVVHIAPQVSGPIEHIYIQNNERVVQGQLIFDIDPAPFEIAVNQARAELDLTNQKVEALREAIQSAKALVDERQSELDVAIKNAKRILALVKVGQETKAAGDDVTNRVHVAEATLKASKSNLAEAEKNLGKVGKENAQIREAESKLNQTLLNLSHTRIIAPNSGQIVNFVARPGTMVQSGVALLDLVNLNDWWVDANFKETQLAHIKRGQKAKIELDIYPEIIFYGYVDSISAGSGSAFSLLPPENATGNWVKVTQRFPVKVIITNPPKEYPLRVGASATVTIDTTKIIS